MILVIRVLQTRYRSDCGWPSGAGFYACGVGNTWRMVIRKKLHPSRVIQYFVFLSRKMGCINRLFSCCKGGNFNIHIRAWFGNFHLLNKGNQVVERSWFFK